MSLWTGLAATALSVVITAFVLSVGFPGAHWQRTVNSLGPLLAVPHVAFAIGLAALLAPSGWLVRLISPGLTGLTVPPQWITTQDPFGIGLITVLVLKEVPFLLWSAAAQLQRADVQQRLGQELTVCKSMGYTHSKAWWCVVWPQIWPRLGWPVLAVLAYSLTVVDVAIIIGPNSPSTLAVSAWEWLQDPQAEANAVGAAAAWFLAGLLAISTLIGIAADRIGFWRVRWTQGFRGKQRLKSQLSQTAGPARRFLARFKFDNKAALALPSFYAIVLAILAIGSVSGVWAFPSLWPQTLTWGAWQSVGESFSTVAFTLGLGAASSLTALLWALAWFELAPPRWNASLHRFVYLPLVLPSVLWVVGLHSLAVGWRVDGHWTGLWVAHSLAVLPYTMIALNPAFLGFDVRYRHITASLGQSHLRFLWRIKWPLLRASLASAAAVGFAVSVAQYLPTLYIGAGRYSTVTTEAVNLAAGAQRSLTSAYALLQWMLPVIGFAIAAWLGKPRRF